MRPLLGLLLASLITTGCSNYSPDMTALESSIEDDLGDQVEDPGVTVDCPDTIEWRVGETFRCIATDSADQRARVTVHMENDAGEYYWALE